MSILKKMYHKIRNQSASCVVGKPSEQFFYPDKLHNRYASTCDVYIALENNEHFLKIRNKKAILELNQKMNDFKNQFLQFCKFSSEDVFYLGNDGTVVVGFLSFNDTIDRNLFARKYFEYTANTISNYEKNLRKAKIDFKKIYSNHEVDKKVLEYSEEINLDIEAFNRDKETSFERKVWIYFYPNIHTAKNRRYFLSREFMETGKELPDVLKIDFFSKYIKPILKKFKKKKGWTEKQLENRHIFMTRQLLAKCLGWNFVYSEKILRQILEDNNTEKGLICQIIDKAKKDNKINNLEEELLLKEYCKYIKPEYAEIILKKYMF